MKTRKPSSQRETALFLKALKEDGIEEIYLETKAKAVKNKAPVSKAVSAKTQGAKKQILEFRETVLKCTQCHELAGSRKSVVFGSGNVKAQLMFVGEAPGRDEDLQGLPFVGRAGQLLTKIIEAMNLSRNQVFIANVLKCRPPENRPPKPDEVLNCEPFLLKQIELIKPRILCALGTFAAQALLKTEQPISALRGKFVDFPGNPAIKVMCTYHPAYLLRSPGEKKKVWEDMKKIMKELQGDKRRET